MAFPRNLTTRSRWRLFVTPSLLLFVLAFALRLYRLGAQSLWLDEGGTWSEVTGRTGKGWLALVSELWSKDAGYPLYHILLKIWVTLAGDSEWALRFPSALAGAAAVVIMYYAAWELGRQTTDDGRWTTSYRQPLLQLFMSSPLHPILVALLFAASPFALWYAQDAKAYSLLMLAVALEIWALLHALNRPGPRAWLALAGISLISLLVHRLALLPAAGAALAYALVWPMSDGGRRMEDRGPRTDAGWSVVGRRSSFWRIGVVLLALVLAAGGVAGMILAVRSEIGSVGGHIEAGPLQAFWLTFTRFSLDRWPGDIAGYLGLPLAIWLLPCAALTLWGLTLLIRDALSRQTGAIAILCMAGAPLLLLLLALALMPVPIYEARYATVAFPAWLLLLAYPFREPRTKNREPEYLRLGSRFLVLGSLLLVNALLLFQPNKGLFSGDPLKEQWRAAVTYIAREAHPDDLIIVHPYYVSPLWEYYAPRVTPDRLPQPVNFPVFAGGDCIKSNPDPARALECIRREYNEPFFNEQAFGKKRALLLIAPDHAKTVDPPKTLAQLLAEYRLTQHQPSDKPPTEDDKYGWVGLRFQYSSDQRTWPCGGSVYVGVEVMCQSYPSTFNAGGRGQVPQPATPLDATFGGQLHLRGYSLDLFDGLARPGGSLPVTLYWDAAAPPTQDYQMFLHLCRDCALPPLANDDGPPLHGYAPAGLTTTWIVGDPVHDERALALPIDLPPGRYMLLLGVYPVGNPAEQARLPVVSAAPVLGATRLVLGEIEIEQR